MPHRLLREQVEARVTARTIELFHKGDRVAAHIRGGVRGRHTTLPEHMPRAHRRPAERAIERIGREAVAERARDGGADHADPAEQAAPGTRLPRLPSHSRLVRSYGRQRLEAVSSRALEIGAALTAAFSRSSLHGLDRRTPSAGSRTGELPLLHPNIRGSGN